MWEQGERPVYRRVLSTVEALAADRHAVVIDVSDLVYEVRRRHPGFNRPTVGQLFDSLDFWQAAGRLRRLAAVNGELVIRDLGVVHD